MSAYGEMKKTEIIIIALDLATETNIDIKNLGQRQTENILIDDILRCVCKCQK